MRCPNCAAENPEKSRFCMRCGTSIPLNFPPDQGTPSTTEKAFSGVRSSSPVQTKLENQGQGVNLQPHQQNIRMGQEDNISSNGKGLSNFPPSANQFDYPPPSQNLQPSSQFHDNSQFLSQRYTQGYTGFSNPPRQNQYSGPSSSNISNSGFNVWGPFAGFGTRRRHIGWLMDGQASRQGDLIQSINQRFDDREIQGVSSYWTSMFAKGVITESRPYFLIQKGLITLGLNIGVFGKDLFISVATYLKPPISQFRVVFLILALLFGFFGRSILLNVYQAGMSNLANSVFSGNSYGSSDTTLLNMLCLLSPVYLMTVLGLYLGLFFSVYKYITEKDFFAILREKPNEFNEDDLMALEKAVEQTVRSSLDDIGLNPADLKPASVQGNEIRLI